MNKRFLVIRGVVILAVSLYFSVARAADVPSWWIGSKADYEKLVKEAQQEGDLVIWAHPDPSCKDLFAGPFEKKYGIKVEHTEYTTAQIVQRILLEGVAGMYTVDVGNLSVHHVPRLEKKGLLKQLPYKERVSTYRKIPGLISPHSTAVIAYTNPRSLAYNTQKVPKDKVPETYEDVLNPMFANRKIGVDTDLKEYIILAQEWGMEKTKDYLKKLGKMKPKYHPNNTVVTQMIASGEVLIGPGVIHRIPLFEFKNKGAPIDWKPLKPLVPLDTMLMGVMAHAPHPHAAALFNYWLLGAPDYLEGMEKCSGYGHAMIPGNFQQKTLAHVKAIPFDWDQGVKAAEEHFGEQFRKIVGIE